MVGMGGFFAGVANVPFSSVIMVMELTGSYGLLVPTLLVATITYSLIPVAVNLYENQVPGRTDSPAHLGSFAVDVLRVGTVREIWSGPPGGPSTVDPGVSLDRLVEMAAEREDALFPVVDAEGRLLGGDLARGDPAGVALGRAAAASGCPGPAPAGGGPASPGRQPRDGGAAAGRCRDRRRHRGPGPRRPHPSRHLQPPRPDRLLREEDVEHSGLRRDRRHPTEPSSAWVLSPPPSRPPGAGDVARIVDHAKRADPHNA